MRFEVDVDDGNSLNTLHKAREAFVAGGGAAPDLPSFVQALMDKALADAIAPFVPADVPAALEQIADLKAENEKLKAQIDAANKPAAQPAVAG